MTCTGGDPDADTDGVCDARDLCPGTPAAAPADAAGCAYEQVDDDADGRCDIGAASAGASGCTGVDFCSGTAAATAIDAYGCANAQLDSDGDGVCNIGADTLRFGLCVDTDSDGTLDASDNCKNVMNAAQANGDGGNAFANRAGADQIGDACDPDDDGDGYTDAQEAALVKNPLIFCEIMRADLDGDNGVSILDLTLAAQKFTQSIPPAPERLNQDAALSISILDLTKMALVFTQNVSACA